MKSYDMTIKMKPLQQYLGMVHASYPDVSLLMCAQSVPFPWSLAVHHQSLAFRARLCHAKNEAPEEEAGMVLFCFVWNSNFWVCGQNPTQWTLKLNLFRSTSTWYHLQMRSLPYKTKSGIFLKLIFLFITLFKVVFKTLNIPKVLQDKVLTDTTGLHNSLVTYRLLLSHDLLAFLWLAVLRVHLLRQLMLESSAFEETPSGKPCSCTVYRA